MDEKLTHVLYAMAVALEQANARAARAEQDSRDWQNTIAALTASERRLQADVNKWRDECDRLRERMEQA